MHGGKEIYVCRRDGGEADRLNRQHNLIMKLTGGPYHNKIPVQNIAAIADVATGTGAWLRDAKIASLQSHVNGEILYFHGFDISKAQFPLDKEGMVFSVHDALYPFPNTFTGRFDLVHISLLVGAIEETDYAKLIQNIKEMLKPEGYLQWVELDLTSFCEGNSSKFPSFKNMLGPFYEYLDENNLAMDVSKAMYQACQDAGLRLITQQESNVLSDFGQNLELRNWYSDIFSAILPPIFFRTGHALDESDAEKKTSKWLADLFILFDQGLHPGGTFNTIVCQKLSMEH